jgi:adenine-specific DNA-methyltransferase
VSALHQTELDLRIPLRDSVLASEIPDEAIDHGEVFTRRWVVDLILDLVGYTPDVDLGGNVAVEPACGSGAFLVPMAERLSEACRRHGRDLREATGAIRASDLLTRNVQASRQAVVEVLTQLGWDGDLASRVASTWITRSDFLLQKHEDGWADFVVGNPPYIRLEDVPDDRMQAYRRACPAMIGRADVYIGFFEKGLRSLRPGGSLGFICADRWMRNQYGRVLRGLVTRDFSLDVTISMHDVPAFEEDVSAYPAISVLHRGGQGRTVVADASPGFGPPQAKELLTWVQSSDDDLELTATYEAARLPTWQGGEQSWPAGSPARLGMIEDLTNRFPPLEDRSTGTKVGIGVATGADAVFVVDDADVEEDRLLRLAMVRDTASGFLRWGGQHLVNPWDDRGRLVDLAHYPRLRRYLEDRSASLLRRNVAGRLPAQWYRTIDKVQPALTGRPKLLFPDLKLSIHPVLDEGSVYPHHNLYYVVSDTWDLRVLGGLLLSRVANAFVGAYAVKMRGGTLRFQAQYLRRIRVPSQAAIGDRERAALAEAFERRDVEAATEVAARLYGISAPPG